MPSVPTGSPRADAQSDFSRVRRRQMLARVGSVLRREPDDVGLVLPFEEVVDALGLRRQSPAGLRSIPLDRIVGSVGRTRDFDRAFRPTSERVRPRWERIAAASRRGEDMPPIDVMAVSDMYFVVDGNHRVSVARALGRTHIEANVTEVFTEVGAGVAITVSELPLKSHERVFFERVPLPRDLRAEIRLNDPWRYGALAEAVEAWGFRVMQECQCYMTRAEVALHWLEEDYRPIVASLRECQMIEDGQTDTEAYTSVVTERYRLMRTHEWSGEILERIAQERG